VNFLLPRAALAALALEVLVIIAVATVFAREPASAQHKAHVVMLTFPTMPVAKPEPQPKKEKPPAPRPKPVHHEVRRPEPKPLPQPKVAETPPVSQQVAAPLPAVEPKPPVPDSAPSVSDVFRSEVRAAVQAAVHYPYAARMAHVSGKVQVSFSYMDGRVGDAGVLVSSGYRMLDDAALEAVKSAAYPPAPPDLAGKPLQFVVWVRFYQSDNIQ
jgi:periplasmic protein TonB